MVKQEHISIPSISGPQGRFYIDRTRKLATNIGQFVPNLALVVHKGFSSLRRYCCHFLIHSFITICRIFSFKLDFNLWEHTIIKCSPSYSILRGKVIFDLLQSSWTILVINIGLFSSILGTNFMTLLVAIAANKNQVDCIGNRLTLNPLHMFQIIHTQVQVSHFPYVYRYPIVT
jgi:hypothetical protein